MDVLQASLQQDWLLDSLEKYEGIYMYELQYPSSCLEWSEHGSSVWLAAMVDGNNSEILQLALPEHLLPPERKTLWAKRDFKLINGAFVKCHITALKYITSSQCVVSGNAKGKVQVWASDKDNPDLLQAVDEIDLKTTLSSSTLLDTSPSPGNTLLDTNPSPPTSGNTLLDTSPSPPTSGNTLLDASPSPPTSGNTLLDASPSPPTLLLSGSSSQLHSLQVHDLGSKQSLFQLTPSHMTQRDEPHPLHSVAFLNPDPHLFVSCSGRGRLDIWDLRGDTPTQPVATTPTTDDTSATPTEQLYSLAISSHTHPSSQLAVLGASGGLDLYDCRNLQCPQAHCQLDNHAVVTSSSRFASEQGHSTAHPCVTYCPTNSHTLSVSGVGKGIRVYDTSTWSSDMSSPSPLFVHHGHEVESPEVSVLVHSWQPHVTGNTLLSVDSQANLHAWQPNIKTQ